MEYFLIESACAAGGRDSSDVLAAVEMGNKFKHFGTFSNKFEDWGFWVVREQFQTLLPEIAGVFNREICEIIRNTRKGDPELPGFSPNLAALEGGVEKKSEIPERSTVLRRIP